jgi:Domain of unknown function (DUF4352)
VTARTNLGVATLALAIALLLAACGGSSSSSSPTGGAGTQASQPKVGSPQRVRTPGTTLVVTARQVIFPLRNSGALLPAGDRAAGVLLAVHNTGKGVYDSSSESDVKLGTSLGADAEPSFAARGPCQTTEIDFLKLVNPGESRSGCVAFDVPKGTKPATVRFSPEGRTALGRTWLAGG